MAKRNWKAWPKEFKSKLDATNSIIGISSAGIGGVGLIVSQPVVAGLGFGAAVLVAAWSAVTSFPVKLISPEHYLHQKIDDFSLIGTFDPNLTLVGFVGPSRAGKTTLLNYINYEVESVQERTDNIYFVVSLNSGNPNLYYGILDGAGQQYYQQFQIVGKSDIAYIFLDHSSVRDSMSVDFDRLKEHEAFLNQLSGYLRKEKKQLKSLHFILNKKDLWETSPQRVDLESWLDNQVGRWKEFSNFPITKSYHSNFVTADKLKLENELRNLLIKG